MKSTGHNFSGHLNTFGRFTCLFSWSQFAPADPVKIQAWKLSTGCCQCIPGKLEAEEIQNYSKGQSKEMSVAKMWTWGCKCQHLLMGMLYSQRGAF